MAVVRVETEQQKMKGAAVLGEGDGPGNGVWGWVAGTLATAVAYIYKSKEASVKKLYDERIQTLEASCKDLKTKSDECVKDREELRVEIAGIKARLPSDQVK